MENLPLSSAEKKELRGLAQRLKPHIHIGKQGLSKTVLTEVETALIKNGLIKVRFESNRFVIQKYSSEIQEKLGCECIECVGKVCVFFRDMPESL